MRPFLKWAGGKYRIVDRINQVLPPGKRLVEPFVGSGAVFLNTNFPAYFLSDSNADLINLFVRLQNEGPDFIKYCKSFFKPENNDPAKFYKFRDRFNSSQNKREKSALFVYLNRHCFNGLCRYNSKGGFNVPFGRYKKPYFPDEEMLFFYEKSKTAEFRQADFKETMRSAQAGDVVYCDPPYVPLSDTANFTSYSSGKFGLNEQKELAELARELAQQGVIVVISNHNTKFTRAVYSSASRTEYFDVRRLISCNGDNRQKASEVLVVFDATAVLAKSYQQKSNENGRYPAHK